MPKRAFEGLRREARGSDLSTAGGFCGSESDIAKSDRNVDFVPVADIRRTATRHEKQEAPTGGTGLLRVPLGEQ
jgi:hypothetical protein